jgi:hypothetical protein
MTWPEVPGEVVCARHASLERERVSCRFTPEPLSRKESLGDLLVQSGDLSL